jgi:hypothetical protein
LIRLVINVIENDCDLNGVPTHMKIADVSKTSDLGAELDVREEGIVGYRIRAGNVRPGMVDRFEYRLVLASKECEGLTAIGTVIVVFAVEPVVAGRIHGDVVDESGARVPGMTVEVRETSQSATTNDAGEFAFESMPAADYTLFATGSGGLASDPATVTVRAGQTAEVELTLKETKNGSIEIKVVDARTGGPISGASVTWHDEASGSGQAHTIANGVVLFGNLPNGRYGGPVTAEGYRSRGWGPVDLRGGTERVEVQLTKG